MVSLRLRHRLRDSLWIVPLRCVLASIALSLVTVAVQLAMGQFSPRIVRTLLQDRAS